MRPVSSQRQHSETGEAVTKARSRYENKNKGDRRDKWVTEKGELTFLSALQSRQEKWEHEARVEILDR